MTGIAAGSKAGLQLQCQSLWSRDGASQGSWARQQDRENPRGKVQRVSEMTQGPGLDGVTWAECLGRGKPLKNTFGFLQNRRNKPAMWISGDGAYRLRKISWKKQFKPLTQVCVTRTCLNSGAKEADKPNWATKRFAGGQETGEKQVLLLWLLTYCRTLECLLQSSVDVLLAAVSATWSMSETHPGTVLWSQLLPPVPCWWLLVSPFPTPAGGILWWNSEDLTKICPTLLALLKTSYWLLISQGPCVSKKPISTHGMRAFVSTCFPKHLVSFWMLCNPKLATC